MDFSDSAIEAELRRDFRKWLADRAPFPEVPDDDDGRVRTMTAWQRELFDAGWGGVSFPVAHGGRGLDPSFEAVVLSELGNAGAPSPFHYSYVARIILEFGSQEQRDRHIRAALRGDERWCQGFSEPDAGSDLAAIRTRARRSSNGWVISGQKVWTSEARWADWCLLIARSEEGSSRHRGLSCFIVPLDAPGMTVRPFRQITGHREFAELFMDEVEVPHDALVGEPGEGWRIAMATVSLERGPADAGFVADVRLTLTHLMQAAVDAGRGPGDPVVQRLVAVTNEVDALEAMVRRHLDARGAGSDPTDASVSKLAFTRAQQALGHLCVDLLETEFVLGRTPDALHNYLWSRSGSIYGGTSQIQRTIVATRRLGLPKTPR